MPISKENKKLYPPNWKEIVAERKREVGDKCEICHAKNGEPHPETGSKVVLTLAHTKHDPTQNEPWDLLLLCQCCHNRWDARWRAKNRREKKKRAEREKINDYR